jgi:hypothetical protein
VCSSDLTVLNLSVRPSWNTDAVKEVLETVADDNGKPPQYIISDNANILINAAQSQSIVHLPDIGHSMAMFVERKYKNDEEFKVFCKEISGVKFREIMRSTAYLLPPNQRSVSRFMNLSPTIEWANNMLNAFERLNEEEQRVFNFIHRHKSIIEELRTLFECINVISKELKNKGLSYKSIKICNLAISQLQQSTTATRITNVLEACSDYLNKMKDKLPDEKTIWHISSDIIESSFGYYKFRKSHNPLNGVTTQIFILPLLTKINKKTGKSGFSVKTALENVFLKDLKQWRTNHLSDNMAGARRKLLSVA